MAHKKKGGFFQRLIVGSEKAEGYARSTLPSNRWELGWDIFKGRFWKLVLLNLMLVVGALGIIFCLVMIYMGNTVIGSSLPFGQNLGFGYPFVEGLETQAIVYEISLSNTYYLLMIPAFMLFGVICSGALYIMRNLVWTEGVFMANDFWRGLKQNVGQMLFVTFLYSVFLFISKFSLMQIEWIEFNGEGNFFFSFSRVSIFLIMILLTMMLLFSMTLSVTYKLKLRHLIKNSFLLTIGLFPQNLFFLFLISCPVLLAMLIPSLLIFVVILYLFFGLSTAALIWTNYSHWIFDKFINDKVEGAEKNRGIYQKVDVKGEPVTKKKKKVGFANPKKKKKAVPEPEINELPTSFSRADLERLEREKQAYAEAVSDYEYESGEDESDEEEYEEEYDETSEDFENDGSEGYEDALKLDGADVETEEAEEETEEAEEETKEE